MVDESNALSCVIAHKIQPSLITKKNTDNGVFCAAVFLSFWIFVLAPTNQKHFSLYGAPIWCDLYLGVTAINRACNFPVILYLFQTRGLKIVASGVLRRDTLLADGVSLTSRAQQETRLLCVFERQYVSFVLCFCLLLLVSAGPSVRTQG